MEPFEYQLVDIGVASWPSAPYLARLLVSVEFLLGMLLILNISLKRFTLPLATAVLVFFSAYLLYRILRDGNSGNCGCFGEVYKMTPLEGILKNAVLLISCAVVYLLQDGSWWKRSYEKILFPLLGTAALCLGFLVYPPHPNYTNYLDKNKINYPLPLELMYEAKQAEKPAVDLRKGKHIIAFLSLSCPHCRIAAQKIHVMNKKNPSIPFYIAMNGEKQMESTFFEDTHVQNIPHNLFLGPSEWMRVAGIGLPVIMYVDNGIVKKKCSGVELDQQDIETWLDH